MTATRQPRGPLTRFRVALLLERAGLMPWTPAHPEGYMVDDWHSAWPVRITTGDPTAAESVLVAAGLDAKVIDARTVWGRKR